MTPDYVLEEAKRLRAENKELLAQELDLRLDPTRLTRERDEARAVAADAKEQLGLAGLVEWLHEFCWCASDAAESNHSADCSAAAWARRIGGLEETQRQVDASHVAALVEEKRLADLARESADYAQNYESDGSDSVGPRL